MTLVSGFLDASQKLVERALQKVLFARLAGWGFWEEGARGMSGDRSVKSQKTRKQVARGERKVFSRHFWDLVAEKFATRISGHHYSRLVWNWTLWLQICWLVSFNKVKAER